MKIKVTALHIKQESEDSVTELYPTLLQLNGENYLFDCGLSNTYNETKAELGKYGLNFSRINKIILSHEDIDHIGALPLFLKSNSNILTLMNETEKPILEGHSRSNRLGWLEKRLLTVPQEYINSTKAAVEMTRNFESCTIDTGLQDGDLIGGIILVVDTPGHTAGHQSFYIPAAKTLIACDALALVGGKIAVNLEYAMDVQAAIRSVGILQKLEIDRLICYHGGELSVDVNKEIDRLMITLKQ